MWRPLCSAVRVDPRPGGTFKGYASHERKTLEAVINARAKATSVKLTADDLSDPAAIERMQQAQGQLSSSLSRLLVVAEQYPDLKANEGCGTCKTSWKGPKTASTWRVSASTRRRKS